MLATNPKVDAFINKAKQWQDEFSQLREIVLDCGLHEELKWGVPCYSHEGKNIVLIHGFKEYCALLFVKGVLLPDPEGILLSQTQNTQASRQIRFRSPQEVSKQKASLKRYVREAIKVEKSGQKVKLKSTAEFDVPAEFASQLDEMPELRSAFAALTPGRQKAYLLHFGGAKQAKTRAARVQKHIQQILAGKGLDD